MPRPRSRPRHQSRPQPPLDERDLAAEVLYLHSLWRRGPPASKPVPILGDGAVPNQSRTTRRRRGRRKRRLGAAETEDAGPEGPLAPSPPASPGASASLSPSPAESTPSSPGSPTQEEAISHRGPSRSARRKANKRKRHELECDAHADAAGSEGRSLAPSPPTAHNAWPDGITSSKPPPPPPSPGTLAHREARRAAAEFFANHGADDEESEGEASESEGDEEAAAGFFTGLFERDAALRGHYERGWEEGQFSCMACAGRKAARRGRARRFRGCVGLVQHARAATRYGRQGAHRALAAVVCRVLGWNIERLPTIVLDPRGTLGQALAARAQLDAEEAKEEVEMEGSNTKGAEGDNELENVEKSTELEDMEDTGPTSSKEISRTETPCNETVQEEGMEDMDPTNSKEISRTEVLCNETVQEEKTNDARPLSPKDTCQNVERCKEVAVQEEKTEDAHPLSPKDTCQNVEHCKEVAVQEVVNATESKNEHAKTGRC